MDPTPASAATPPSPRTPTTPPVPPAGAASERSGAHPAAPVRRVRRELVAALLGVAAVVVLLDQLAKAWAVRALADGRSIDLAGSLAQLRLFRNPGAAFSLATGTTWIFTVIATVVSVVIVRIARRLGSAWWALALGLLLGGALGNLVDRLFREPGFARGHVVDFIDLPHLFVFNLADASITVAAVLIALFGLRGLRIEGDLDAADGGRGDDHIDGGGDGQDDHRGTGRR
jgi:signal peptidase II